MIKEIFSAKYKMTAETKNKSSPRCLAVLTELTRPRASNTLIFLIIDIIWLQFLGDSGFTTQIPTSIAF